MRVLSLFLTLLMVLATPSAAQRVQNQDGLSLPSGKSSGRTFELPQGQSGGRIIELPSPRRVCPSGTQGIWPNCIGTGSRECPQGTKGKWPDCKKIVRSCPKGTAGKWPDCKKIVRACPKGTTGSWPNCKSKPVASCADKGLAGLWPNCREPDRRRCPSGTTGKWPDCSAVTKDHNTDCPSGRVRKGKECVKVTTGAPGGKAPPPSAAPNEPQEISPAIAVLTADRPHRPKEILVLVAADRASEIAARIAGQYNVTAEPRLLIPLLDGALVHLTIPDNRSLESLLQALSVDPDVELAQPNYDYEASGGPARPGKTPQYAGEKLHLDEAHRLARGQGVMIAVIDTAIDAAHPELVGAVAGVFDAVGEGPVTPEPHGTEIAGILVARAELTGVAPEAKLLSVRAFRGGGGKNPATSTSLQLLKGINWAFSAGARVMNMSFTGPTDPLLERIVKRASEKGVILIAAAGNNGPKGEPVYPAAYPEVIAVTATDESDRLYGKANRGDYISVAAPGVDIIAPALKGGYDVSSGTSMAAAHVSGVVALLLEHDGKMNWNDARAILSSSARKPDGSGAAEAFGAGIVDAASALNAPH
jgi:Subtilase family